MNLERINKTQEELNSRLLDALRKIEELLSQALGGGQLKEPVKKEVLVREGLLHSIYEKQEEAEALINSLHLKVSRLENIVVDNIINIEAPILNDDRIAFIEPTPKNY